MSPEATKVAPAQRQQAFGEHVVGELADRALTRGRTHPGASASSPSRRREASRDRVDVARRTTNPVSPSTTASCEPPLRPATDGTPHAAASTNTMPNPSASRPPQRSRHSIENTSADA